MLTKKQAVTITRNSELLVYSEIDDIGYLIQLHAELGMDEMEIFIEKKAYKKIKKVLDKKGFYSRTFEFKSLEHECKLYISWISSL